ncbi:MAG TPA: uroporphyrinogen-III synthase [Sphingomicrobium sp.]|nr:uroporphyrinogen-III synthase [Sphingomicrobium sp.]
MRKLLLLRPEPGLSASAGRALALGMEPLCCPLFRVEPQDWRPPDPNEYDGLLLTSANGVRHAGPQLDALQSLPVHAVGRATAEAAREAGFDVKSCGSGDVADLLATLPALRLLHLAGEDHRAVDDAGIDRRIVYRSVPITEPGLPPIQGLVVAIHSPRAGARLAELAHDRNKTIVAAISDAAARACGMGWEGVAVAAEPDDESLLALAATLCQTAIK